MSGGNQKSSVSSLSWLVYGAEGFIGDLVVKRLSASGQLVSKGSRVRAYEDILGDIAQTRPDRIVCCLGRTHTSSCATIDALELEGSWIDQALANHNAPIWVAQAAAKHEVPMAYFGTGCIYSHPSRVYTEDDAPDFFGSSYSRVKALTDAVLSQMPNVGVFRIRMPIAHECDRDLVSKLMSYETICDEGRNSVSVLEDIVPAILAMCHEAGPSWGGVFNAVNPEGLLHSEILAIFREVAGRAHRHTLVSSQEELSNIKAPRSCCVLSPERFQRALAAVGPRFLELYGAPGQLPPASISIARSAASRRPMRRLLVTGGCGFIGSYFVDRWLESYPNDLVVNVDCLDLESGSREAAVRHREDPRYTFVKLDISLEGAETRLLGIMQERGIDHLVHFAAKTHVDHSFKGDTALEYSFSNIIGTHRLLEASRRHLAAGGNLIRFLHMSTDEVYGCTQGQQGGVSSLEDSALLMPSNPYAATKAAAEMLVHSYTLSHAIPGIVARCNNVYGPGQFHTKVIPRFCMLARIGRPLTVHGTGTALRCFLHVDDACRALSILAQNGKVGETYNIGSGLELSIGELAEKIARLSERPVSVHHVEDRLVNDQRYIVDDTKIKEFGWSPARDFDQGLRDCFERSSACDGDVHK